MRIKMRRLSSILVVLGIVLLWQSALWAALPNLEDENGADITTFPDPIEDQPYSVTFFASDPEGGQAFDITSSNLPDFLVLEQTDLNEARLYAPTPPTKDLNNKSFSFQINVKDAQEEILSQPFSITVQPFNDRPEIIDGGDIKGTTVETKEDKTYLHSFEVTDEETPDQIRIKTVTIDQELLPADFWLSVDPDQNSAGIFNITGLPTNDDVGSFVLKIVLTDDNPEDEGTVSLWYTLKVTNVNDRPVISAGGAGEVPKNVDQYSEQRDTPDTPDTPKYQHTFTVKDDDGDEAKIDVLNSTYPGWLIVQKPENAYNPNTKETTFNIQSISEEPSNDKLFSDNDPPNSYPVDIVIVDGNGANTHLTYTLTVNNFNEAPSIIKRSEPLTQIEQGYNYTYDFIVEDIDRQPVSRDVASVIPDWLTLVRGEDTSLEPGQYAYTLKAKDDTVGAPNSVAISGAPSVVSIVFTDGEKTTEPLDIQINVANTNDTPEIFERADFPLRSEGDVEATEDAPFLGTFQVKDIDKDSVRVSSATPIWINPTDSPITKTETGPNGEVQTFEVTFTPDNAKALMAMPIPAEIVLTDADTATNPKEVKLSFNLVVINENDDPEIPDTVSPPSTATEDKPYSYTFSINDIDGDIVILDGTQTKKPSWLKVIELEGKNQFRLEGTPRQEDIAIDADGNEIATQATIVFTDQNTGSVTLDIGADQGGIIVQNVNDPPSISGASIALEAGKVTIEDPYLYEPTVHDEDATTNDMKNLQYLIYNQPPSTWSFFETFQDDQGNSLVRLKLYPSESVAPFEDDVTITVSDGKASADLTFTVKIVTSISKGDFNLEDGVNLADAILGLQISAGIQPNDTLYVQEETDVDGDLKFGLQDVIYILNYIATQ